MDTISNLPMPMKAGGGTVAAGGLLGATYYWFKDWTFVLIVLGGLLLLVLLFLAWRYYARRGRASKLRNILSGAQSSVVDGSNTTEISNEFYEGLKTFLTRAKNPESKPWYIVVGESSSGKTQAIINSQIRFIQKSSVSGVGGTMGMKWWFTQEAVILDTAGRLMLPPEMNQSSMAWREFLRLLKKERSNCPINGLFLMISAESLLEYTSEKINDVAGVIASRFEEIQDELGVRFPVYVFITKCDLINGFNEFFEDLSDPRLQNQMLGWSNPANLDEDFDPALVDEHLEAIKQRMLRRRAKLLLNPPPSIDPNSRRLDQVDALFNLPESITKIGSRLRLYLETIFAGGADEKHLFLRGIYFTCAMQRGAPIDADLAAALGVPLDQLPKERAMNRMRSFFLRDVFVEKAFKEKGLITRAHNVNADKVRKRATVIGAAIALVCLLIGITFWSSHEFRSKIGQHAAFFGGLGDGKTLGIRDQTVVTSPPLKYQKPWFDFTYDNKTRLTLPEMLDDSNQLARAEISTPWMLKPVELIGFLAHGPTLNKSIREDNRLLFESLVLKPLVTEVRNKMSSPTWDTPGQPDLAALVELIRLEKPPAAGAPPSVNIKALIACLMTPADYSANGCDHDAAKFQEVFNWTYDPNGGKAPWPPVCLGVGTKASFDPIISGVNSYRLYCQKQQVKSDDNSKLVLNLGAAFDSLKVAEEGLAIGFGPDPDNSTDYENRSRNWKLQAQKVIDCGRKVDGALADLKASEIWEDNRPINALYGKSRNDVLENSKKQLNALLAEVPDKPDPMLDVQSLLKSEIRKIEDQQTQLANDKNAVTLKQQNEDFLGAASDLDRKPETRYRVQVHMVKSILEQFPTTSQPADLQHGLDASLKSLDHDLADTKTTLEVVQQANDLDKQLQKLGDCCVKTALYGMIGPRKATDLVNASIDRLKDTPDAWQQASVVLNQKLPVAPQRPVVPMTKMAGGPYDAQYSPELVRQTLAQVKEISAHMAEVPAADSPRLLDRDILAALMAKKKTAWNSYTANYVTYWTSDVEADLKVDPDSWDVMRQHLIQDMRERLALQALESLGKDMSDALTSLEDPARQADIGVIASALRNANNPNFLPSCKDVIDRWIDLGDDPLAARKTLMQYCTATGSREFRAVYNVEGASSDFVVQYWKSITDAALASLTKSADEKARGLVQKLANAHRFPLDKPGAGQVDLTPEELNNARDVINQLIDTAAAGAPATPGVDEKAIGPDLLRLRNLTSLKNEKAWLASVSPMLNFLPDSTKTATFSVKLLNSTDKMSTQCDSLRIRQQDGVIGSIYINVNPNTPSTFAKPLSLPGGPIVIEAGKSLNNVPNPADNVKMTWKFGDDQGNPHSADYSMLRLFFARDPDTLEQVDASHWKLTLHGTVQNIGPNNSGTIVLELTLDAKQALHNVNALLPDPDHWPGLDGGK